MPKGWFFEIHEDSPEQEAANLMEHSASVLDISSDDDVETKALNEERGKENIPPPGFLSSRSYTSTSPDALDDGYETEILIEEPVKRPRLRKFVQDSMDEDRKPLGDLAPSEFYGEGCNASSYVTVDTGIEKPSSLSRECDFAEQEDVREEEVVEEAPAVEEVEKVQGVVAIYEDASATETSSSVEEAASQEHVPS
jgi:hypothetical protein